MSAVEFLNNQILELRAQRAAFTEENVHLRGALAQIEELDGEFGSNQLSTDCSEADGFRSALLIAKAALSGNEHD